MNDDAGKKNVIIFTRQFEISGSLNIYQGVRLTDYMNESNAFISVTDVTVKRRPAEGVFLKAGFLNVRKDEVEMIVPEDSLIGHTP